MYGCSILSAMTIASDSFIGGTSTAPSAYNRHQNKFDSFNGIYSTISSEYIRQFHWHTFDSCIGFFNKLCNLLEIQSQQPPYLMLIAWIVTLCNNTMVLVQLKYAVI